MEELLTTSALISLLSLTFLEVMLGIDNVIFVSILMGRLPEEQQKRARQLWMIMGITVRSLLLLGLGWLMKQSETPLFHIANYGITLKDLIMIVGGLFLMIKTVSEIHAKLEGDEHTAQAGSAASFSKVMIQVMLVDMVFSVDSIVAAVGMVQHVSIMIAAVLIAMPIMFFFAVPISNFIHKHPTFKMLALSFLMLIGFTLFFDGFEAFHHSEIPKGYVYFSMVFAFGVELLNMKVRKPSAKPVELHEPMLDEKKS